MCNPLRRISKKLLECVFGAKEQGTYSAGMTCVVIQMSTKLVPAVGAVQSLSRVHLFVTRLRGLQHARLPCPSPSPGACSNSCPLNQRCHPAVSSCVLPFSFCLQAFPAAVVTHILLSSSLCIPAVMKAGPFEAEQHTSQPGPATEFSGHRAK